MMWSRSRAAALTGLATLLPLGSLAQRVDIPTREQQCTIGGIDDAPACLVFERPRSRDVSQILSRADPSDLFAVSMDFSDPVRLGRLREFAIRFEVPRILARLEVIDAGGRPHPLLPFYLGLFAENKGAWPREVCQARVTALAAGSQALEKRRPEDWEVREIHVLGSAYAVRELMSGSSMTRARLVDGAAQAQSVLPAFEDSAESNLEEPITNLVRGPLPPECRQFAPPVPVPILSGMPDDVPDAPTGDDFRAFIQGQLSRLAPDVPVTMQLNFAVPPTIAELADFVSAYSIDGLKAAMEAPDAEGRRFGWGVELSDHGEAPSEQAAFQLCFFAAFPAAPSNLSQWRAPWATVSLTAASAWPILTNDNLRAARLVSAFSVGALDEVKTYYEMPIAQRDNFRPMAGPCAPISQ